MPRYADSVKPENTPPGAVDDPAAARMPLTVRVGGVCVTLEGLTGVVVAIAFVVRGLMGHQESGINNYGTAAWFGILGSAVLAAGVALVLGRRGGYVVALMVQLLLLPVVWTLLTGSGQIAFGVVLGIVAVGTLVLLCAPASLRWKSAV